MNIQDNGWRDISIWELSVFQFIVQSVCKELFWLLSLGFSGGSAGKEFAFNVGDLGSIPGLGRSPGEGKDYPLLYSGLRIQNSGWQRVGHD